MTENSDELVTHRSCSLSRAWAFLQCRPSRKRARALPRSVIRFPFAYHLLPTFGQHGVDRRTLLSHQDPDFLREVRFLIERDFCCHSSM
jgi:hypothetical protein